VTDEDDERPDAAGKPPAWPPGGHVDWRPWGEAAFADAADAQRPILLSLTTAWSAECRQMDAETYGEPRVAAAVDDGFVPIRADADRNPRVAARYSVGGVPSTLFLTPDGTVLRAAGPLGVDEMRNAIQRVRNTWADEGAAAGTLPRPLEDDRTPAGDLDDAIEGRLLSVLQETFDEQAGGWGTGAKFPLPRAVEFALKRDRTMARRTLDAIDDHLRDEHHGGFYRGAEHRDWSGVRPEKLADVNAALVRAFTAGYRYTGEERYRAAASHGVDFLRETLWSEPVSGADGFAASETPIPDEDDIDGGGAPAGGTTDRRIDRTRLGDWNALAADALLTYAGVTDDERAREHARQTLDTIANTMVDRGQVVHAVDVEGTPLADDERALLVDHARVVRALVTARSVLGPGVEFGERGGGEGSPLELAEDLAGTAIEDLHVDGSFLDGPPTGAGLLDRPYRPLAGNVAMASALLDLAVATGDEEYLAIAEETAAAFADAGERLGPQAAAFGSLAGRLHRGTLRVDVTAPVGSDLHRAALRIADHEAIVLPVAGADPADAAPAAKLAPDAAYVVAEGERIGPARTPEELLECVAEAS